MGQTLDDVVTDFQSTGNCGFDIDLVVKKWNHTWFISQWSNEYTLCKFTRMGTPCMRFKFRISDEDANELIERLNLSREQSGVFRSGGTWRQEDVYYAKLKEYNKKRNNWELTNH